MVNLRGHLVGAIVIAACLLACGGQPAPPLPTADAATRRALDQGELVGFTSEAGAHVWRGIPFARPPVGALRWRAPQPPEPWTGTREALDFGNACVQFAGPMGGGSGLAETDVRGSEDCLYLNVFAPPFAKDDVPTGDERLPVMFWIHGGGNTIGDARIYDASTFAVRQNVVVVTIHYRLGVLGWFDHPSLHGPDASAGDRSGNYGTLDTVRALAWVRENASAFGGDPGRVTVFGESAGGTDTFALLASPRAAGLFHRAIAQSGGTLTVPPSEARNPHDATPPGHRNSSAEVLLGLLVADGRAADRAAAVKRARAMTPATTASYLRGQAPEALLARFAEGGFGGMYDVPMLFRDGHVLPTGEINEAFEAGRYNAVPVILGTNRDENKLFMLPSSPHVARVGPIPLWFKDERMYDLGAEYGARLWKARGADEPAEAIATSGRSPVWVYRFDWDEEGRFLWADLSRLLGAAHAVELPFVFGTLNLGRATEYVFPPESRDEAFALAHVMMDYWTALARHGDPNRAPGAPAWPAWQAGGGRYLIFDSARDGGVETASGALTQAKVLAAVSGDERFASDAERCEVYGQMALYSNALTMDGYRTIQNGICRDVPLPE